MSARVEYGLSGINVLARGDLLATTWPGVVTRACVGLG